MLSILFLMLALMFPNVSEDSPLFDCRIHGNQICGPGAVLPDGTIVN